MKCSKCLKLFVILIITITVGIYAFHRILNVGYLWTNNERNASSFLIDQDAKIDNNNFAIYRGEFSSTQFPSISVNGYITTILPSPIIQDEDKTFDVKMLIHYSGFYRYGESEKLTLDAQIKAGSNNVKSNQGGSINVVSSSFKMSGMLRNEARVEYETTINQGMDQSVINGKYIIRNLDGTWKIDEGTFKLYKGKDNISRNELKENLDGSSYFLY